MPYTTNPLLQDEEDEDYLGGLTKPQDNIGVDDLEMNDLADESQPQPDGAVPEEAPPVLAGLDDSSRLVPGVPGVTQGDLAKAPPQVPAAFGPSQGTVPDIGPRPVAPQTRQDKLNDILAKAPQVYQHQKPSILRRLGAAATGAAAGVYNANPYERPVDMSHAIGSILYPGQAQKEQQYQVELAAAKEAAEQERAETGAASSNSERAARTDYENAHAGYYEKVGDARVRQILQKEKQPLEKYNELMQVPGMTTDRAITLATTGKEPVVAKNPAGLVQVTPDLGKKLGVQPNKDGEFWAPSTAVGANLKVENPPDTKPNDTLLRMRAGGAKTGNAQIDAMTPAQAHAGMRSGANENSGEPKPMTKGQGIQIEQKKQAALQKAAREAAQRVRGDRLKGIPPEDPDAVKADLAEQQDNIQHAYEQELMAATGNELPHNDWALQGAPPPKAVSAPRNGRGGNTPAPAQSQNVRMFNGHPYVLDQQKGKWVLQQQPQ